MYFPPSSISFLPSFFLDMVSHFSPGWIQTCTLLLASAFCMLGSHRHHHTWLLRHYFKNANFSKGCLHTLSFRLSDRFCLVSFDTYRKSKQTVIGLCFTLVLTGNSQAIHCSYKCMATNPLV
jgi:hypothetical protein